MYCSIFFLMHSAAQASDPSKTKWQAINTAQFGGWDCRIVVLVFFISSGSIDKIPNTEHMAYRLVRTLVNSENSQKTNFPPPSGIATY